MPVITRSKTRLLSTSQDGELQLLHKPSKICKRSPKTTKSNISEQHCDSGRPLSTPRPQGGSHKLQASSEKNPSQIATDPPSPVLFSDITKALWPCKKCSCTEGIFKELVDSCLQCNHVMDDHMLHWTHPWNPQCDSVCERQELTASVLDQLQKYGVVIIRATPQVGKTTLLYLLGYRILSTEPNLEPVHMLWKKRETRGALDWNPYLESAQAEWRERHATVRPHNPNAQVVYLIDEAQGSYEEEGFWTMLKNYHNLKNWPKFVLICVYGADGVSHIRNPNIESQALCMYTLHRIELRPSEYGNPYMLFKQEETNDVIRKWATTNGFQLKDGVLEYLHRTTDGHPGMVGLLLNHFREMSRTESTLNYYQSTNLTNNSQPEVGMTKTVSTESFHNLIVQHENSFVEWLSRWGRGVWSPRSEDYTISCLRAEKYSHLNLSDIQKALRKVAIRPDGYTRLKVKDFDAFAYCHEMGYLHTERPKSGKGETTFLFASPLHRRVAYRRLLPGREPDAALKSISLQQISINAITRFSPAVLQNRQSTQSNRGWGIPEATFQNELYSCLLIELRYLPILSEYSHTKDGRIDFYVSGQRWGIEVLQCGTSANIATHAARFTAGGNYQKWGILNDYIILNFCPRSALRDVKIQDKKSRSHILQVVVEPDEYTAEIYTHDKQLQKTCSLGEGRQRFDRDYFKDLSLDTVDSLASLQDQPTAREREMRDGMELQMELQMERVKRETEERVKRETEERVKRETEERIKEMELQMERQKENFERQIQESRSRKREDDQKEGIAQEQEESIPRKYRKKKR